MRKYQVDSAIRFEAEFRDWDLEQALVDPTLIKFTIYDLTFKPIAEFTVNNENRIGEGNYFYHYVPSKTGVFYFEWSAMIEGLPSVLRDSFEVVDVL